MGLARLYREGLEIKKYVKALKALTFINFDQIFTTFNELQDEEIFEILTGLYNYFKKTYICRPNEEDTVIYPPYIWNVYQFLNTDLSNTNNTIEGLINFFKCKIVKTVNSLPKLINLFLEEESKRYQKIIV